MTHNRRGVRQWGGGGGGWGFLTTAYFADNGILLQAALRALDETQIAECDILSRAFFTSWSHGRHISVEANSCL